jgi:endoribonuclease Nob1
LGTRVLVLDTSAFIMGFSPSSVSMPTFSVPAVLEELSSRSFASLRSNASIETGKLIVRTPTEKSLETVHDASSDLGEKFALSDTDFQVLALAVDLRSEGDSPTIVSDDYAVQNVAEHLKLGYASLATFGISRRFGWILFCPACYRKYPQDRSRQKCEVCGTELRRRVKKRTLILKQ